MKDLYRKLGLSPTSNVTDVRAALASRKSSLSNDDIADIEHVLLAPLRRQKYDHVHRTIQCIADIRDQIDIPESSGQRRARIAGFVPSKRQVPNPLSNQGNQQQDLGWGGAIAVVVFMAAIVFLIFWINQKEAPPEIPNLSTSQKHKSATGNRNQEYFVKPAIETGRLATPTTGIIERYDSTESLAPLEIHTRRGSGNYYVKISRIVGNRLILSRTAFIRDGETLETTVPLGNYEIRYAIGDNWYGTNRHFGKSTSYAKADDVFSFQETSRGYSGFTVELHRQINGNLETDPLTAEEF